MLLFAAVYKRQLIQLLTELGLWAEFRS